MNESESLMCLNAVSGLGSLRIRRLYDAFGSASAVWKAGAGALKAVVGIGEQIAAHILDFDCNSFLKEETALLKQYQAQVITFFDQRYPGYLKEVVDCPVVLYLHGQWDPAMFPGLAIVGCRRSSIYGLSVAGSLAAECAGLGITVVSGMARGIDTAAHDGCLKAKGKTVAVLGSGLARIYPRENKRLFEMIAKNGCVISECPMSTGPLASNFPRRNRIISGLSCGVIVVEAAARSGALITAQCALEQGRDVFAVPGKIGQSQAVGTNRLIQQGAKLVFSIEDVIEDVPVLKKYLEGPNSVQSHGVDETPRAQDKIILDLLADDPVYIDDIIEKSQLEYQVVLKVLLHWECRGRIKRLPGNYFIKK